MQVFALGVVVLQSHGAPSQSFAFITVCVAAAALSHNITGRMFCLCRSPIQIQRNQAATKDLKENAV